MMICITSTVRRLRHIHGAGMVKISIKEFHDGALPFRNVYTPINVAHQPNGREQLRLAVATDFATLGAESIFFPPREARHTGH